jgi:endonuclease/exonuclease/phosphatase family metal-dependent hydrolase
VARVLGRLDPDLLVLQEIVSFQRLEAVLSQAPRRLSIRQGDRFVTSADHRARDYAEDLKIALAFDPQVFELVHFGPLRLGRRPRGTRRPLAAHLRHRDSGWELTVIGLHLKSGPAVDTPDDPNAALRTSECALLAGWLTGAIEAEDPALARPPTADVLLAGDFNAARDSVSLAPLRDGLVGWTWHPPAFPAEPGEDWTSRLETATIDHLVTSPTLTPRCGRPEAYAFDLDPAFDRPPPDGPRWLRQRTDFRAVILPGGSRRVVENLYRVSDHRPLCMPIRPA